MARTHFGCDACASPIAPIDPRVRCLECSEYDLCADCAVAERFTSPHTAAHQTLVFKMSGSSTTMGVAANTSIVYVSVAAQSSIPQKSPGSPLPALPPALERPTQHLRHMSMPQVLPELQRTSTASALSEIANQQMSSASPLSSPIAYSRPSLPTHMETSPQPQRHVRRALSVSSAGISRPQPQQNNSSPAVVAYTPPPCAGTFFVPSPANAYSAPAYTPPSRDAAYTPLSEPARGWGPFFAEDMSPTPVLTQLLDAIFAYLDTGRTGYLAPEAYSRFLVNQGCVGAENSWNANLTASLGKTKKEAADAALKRTYDALGVEHILRPRAPERPMSVRQPSLTRTLQTFGASFARALVSPPTAGSAMPVLTRAGFADVTAIALLTDPARAWVAFTRVLKMYALPLTRAWGLLPRDVLPAQADPQMLDRVARGTAAVKEQGGRERGERIVQNVFAVENAVAVAALASDTLSLVGNSVGYYSN
ncbi:hypothetical protein B0H17DRAFT_1186239 [Mycena rosella]|uniref:ZZ-type domain-containing protein n=1 Tax=Mycena rosella TaxID=1033263 RepID=A0AAD7G0U5_MYCRO|nr:hypothetical protein B0H17DRAFT_1186239 [Mycena rosella]